MNISRLIAELKSIKKEYGDLPVIMASDEEQNTLGDILALQIGNLTDGDYYEGDTLGLIKSKQKDQIFVVIVPKI